MSDHPPVPDPTLLTTAQLLREQANLRGILEARLDGMDKVVSATKELVSAQMQGQSSLIDEKFKGVEDKFLAAATAVSAALQAQKDAAAKSEDAFSEKHNGLATLLDRGMQSLSEKVSDLSSRLDRSESANNNAIASRGEGRQYTALLLTACMAAAAVISVLVALFVTRAH